MRHTAWIIAYHGCDKKIGESIIAGKEELRVSKNPHDWLGGGAYFWESSYSRALKWAKYLKTHPQASKASPDIKNPFVIGAIIDPGNCLDLCNDESLQVLKEIYPDFEKAMARIGAEMPKNEPGFPGDLDLAKRGLDCAVIDYLHAIRKERKQAPFDSVRCPFMEGGSLFLNSMI